MEETRTDAELLAAFNHGEEKAFNQLLARYQKPLYNWLWGKLSSADDANDVFQETWIRVAKHAQGFTGVSFRSWLWRIARNLVIDMYRRRKDTLSLDAETTESATLLDILEAPDATPVDILSAEEAADTARRVIGELPEIQREVLTMRMQGGLSFAEIADALHIPVNTALGRMHDAVTKIRIALNKEMNK